MTWNNQKTQALETAASTYQQRLKEVSVSAETSEGKAAFSAMVAPVTH